MDFSISKADLVRHCQAPFRDDWGAPPPYEPKPYTLLGQIYHELCAQLIAAPEPYASVDWLRRARKRVQELSIPGDIEEHIALFVRLDPQRRVRDLLQKAQDARAEVAYAIDLGTGRARELGVDIGRRYREHGMVDGEFGGAADVVWTSTDVETGRKIAHIRDWKVTWGVASHVTPAAENGQLMLLAHAACAVTGATQAQVEIFAIDARTGEEHVDSARHRRITLMRRAVELKQLLGDPEPQPTPGRHCVSHYCPFVGTCPAVGESIRSLSTDITPSAAWPVVDEPRKIQSQQHAAYLYEMVRQVKKAASQLEEVLQRYARDRGGIEVAPGVRWGPTPNRRQYILSPSVEELADALEPYLGGADVAKLVQVSVTKSALEKAVRAASDKTGVRYTMRDVMAALESARLVETRQYEDKYVEKKDA